MMFKLIHKREMERFLSMLESNDSDMRKLAIAALRRKRRVHFSFTNIFLFHILISVATLTMICYLKKNYTEMIGDYLVPIIFVGIIQFVYSINHILAVKRVRAKYNYKIQETVDRWI